MPTLSQINKAAQGYSANLPPQAPKQNFIQKAIGGVKGIAKDALSTLIVTPATRIAQAGLAVARPFTSSQTQQKIDTALATPQTNLGITVQPQKSGMAGAEQIGGQALKSASYLYGGEGLGGIAENTTGGFLSRTGQGILQGGKVGLVAGAGAGAGNAMEQGGNFGQVAGDAVQGGLTGALTGGVIGGATGALHPIFQRSNPILDPNAVSPYDVGAATANREAASVNAVKGINEMNQAAQSDISQMGQEFRQGAVNLEKKLSSNDNPLLQEAKKYKSAEEFVKAQGKPAFHGSDKASLIEKQGFKIMPSESARGYGDGIYFTETKANAKGYGDVVHSYIPKDLNLYKATEADTYKIDTKKLMAEGYDGVKLPGTGGFTIFDTSKIKTKSQLTDIWNKASKSQLSPTVNLTKGQLEQLNNIRETKNFALPDFANTEGTQATLGGKPINLGAMNPKVAAQIGASQGEIGASLTPTQMQDLMTQVNRATIQAKSTGEFAVNQQLIGLRNELKTASSKAFGPEWDKIYSNFAQGHSVMEKLDGIVNLDPKATPVELNKQLATIQKLGETPEGQKFLQQAIEEYKNVRGIDLTDPVAAANSVLKAQGQLEIAQEGSYGTRLVRALKNPNLAARRIALVATALLGLTAGATAFRKQIASFFTGQ